MIPTVHGGFTDRQPPVYGVPYASRMAIADVTPGEQKLMTAIGDLVEQYEALVAAESDPQTAFEIATRLERGLAAHMERVGAVRSDAVIAIRDHEKLSLAQLADRIGVSKTRAAVLVSRAIAGIPAGITTPTPPEREAS